METVKVKIVEFEENSGSLVVRFASDTTKNSDPDSYRSIAYQPALMWPEATTNEEILENLGRCAIAMCQEIEIDEALKADTVRINSLKSLVNTEVTFTVSDLIESDPATSSTTTENPST